MSEERRICPRCRSLLVEREGGTHRLLVCKTCGGLFARGVRPSGVSESLHEGAVREGAAAASGAVLLRDDHAGAVACPECPSRLARYRIEQTEIELDACATHGVWFDRDELPRLAKVASPGVRLRVTAVAVVGPAVAASAAAVAMQSPPRDGSGTSVAEGAVEVTVEVLGEILFGIFD